jgi:hypothetical protein
MPDNQNPQQTPDTQYQGTSNAEDITNVSVPNSNDSTVPTATAQSTPPTASTPASTPDSKQQAPQQTPVQQPPQAAQASTPPAQGPQQPSKINDPKQEQTQVISKAPMNPMQQQQVQKAGVWHTIAETLAGGPRFSYTVDEYGNTKREKVPVSTAHLALAVAMEALQGAAIGASQQGPNAAGKAAAAGFAASQQRVQQQDQQSRGQAQEDFKNRMQTTETNMRMYTMAKQIGKLDFDQNQAYVGQFKDMGENLQKNFPGFVEGPIGYKDFAKYNVTQANAIPVRTVPRLDSDGKQVNDKNGIPQWDNEYLIVKPGLKATNLLGESDIKELQNMGVLPKGASADMIINTPMQLTQAMNLKSQVAQWGVGKSTYDSYYKRIDNMKSGTTKIPDSMPTITPTIANKQLDTLADTAADKYNVNPAFVKGLITTESSGNINTPDSKAHTGGGSRGGAIGPMQVMLSTAGDYGVTDPNVLRNPERNVDVGVHYFSDLLNSPNVNGDPKLAAAAYIGGLGVVKPDHTLDLSGKSPENKKAILDYIDKFTKNTGLGINNVAAQAKKNDDGSDKSADKGSYLGQLDSSSRMSLDEWNEKYPSTRGDNEKFLGILAHTENNYGQALKELETKDPRAASNMAAFLGGPEGIANHDLSVKIDGEQRKTDEAVRKSQELIDSKQKTDDAAQKFKQDMMNTLEQATIPPDVLNMDPKDVVANLQGQGVTLAPETIRDALTIAKYKAPITIASNKLWFKDKSPNQQDILNVVRQLNPDYDVSGFDNLKAYKNPNSKPNQTVVAAAGVANHLNLLLDAAKEVSSAGQGASSFPILNRLENSLNYHSGGTAYSRLAALTNAVNGEMGKVLSGGFAPDKEQTAALMKNMTPENALQQVQALSKVYTDIMYGKVLPYDQDYSKLSQGQHMPNIPDSFTNLVRRQGLNAPWAKDPEPPVSGAQAGRDPSTGEVKAWKLPDGRVVPVNGATGNRVDSLVNSLRQ